MRGLRKRFRNLLESFYSFAHCSQPKLGPSFIHERKSRAEMRHLTGCFRTPRSGAVRRRRSWGVDGAGRRAATYLIPGVYQISVKYGGRKARTNC